MHGLILTEYKSFVESTEHTPDWQTIAEAADVGSREYNMQSTYPDEEVLRVVETTSELMEAPASELLTEYGTHVAYSLLDIYSPLLGDDWGSLEFMMGTEERFHPTVRDRSLAAPPYLHFERQGPHEVTLTYESPRQLCPIAIGIARALEEAYDETLRITEEQCMHDGADHCFIRFERVSEAPSPNAGEATAASTTPSA